MFISYEAKKPITRPSIARLCISGCSLCVRMGTYIVIARTLGAQNFGILLFVQWTSMILLPLVGIGMTSLASSRIVALQQSESRYTLASIFHLRWRLQCQRILLYCIIYVPATYILSLLIHGQIAYSLFLVAGIAATPLLLSSIATTTLQGLHRHNLLATLRLLSTLFNICLIYFVTRGHGTLIGLLLLAPAFTSILTLTLALACIAFILPLRDAVELGPLVRERIEQSQRPTLLAFLVDTIVWRELLFLILLLITWHKLANFGFYVFSLLLCTHLIELIPTIFVTCVLPLLARLAPTQHFNNPYNAFIKTSYSLALLAGTVGMSISFFCPLFIYFCFGSTYLPMITPLRILLLGAAFGSVATVGLTYLLHNQHKRLQTWLNVGVAVLHIGLAIPCILLWGIVGAALASTIAHIVSSLGTTLLCRRILQNS